jgi:hypothetical protein
MQESVIPSDSQLVRALEPKRPHSRRQIAIPSAAGIDAAAALPPISRGKVPVPPRASSAADLHDNISSRRADTLNPQPLISE